MEGKSLTAILKDPKASVQDAAIGRYQAGDTIRTERYRYSVYQARNGKPRGHMLYDHETDPDENVNVADDPKYAEIVAELAAKLEAGKGR